VGKPFSSNLPSSRVSDPASLAALVWRQATSIKYISLSFHVTTASLSYATIYRFSGKDVFILRPNLIIE
jgi:hypothetical protein